MAADPHIGRDRRLRSRSAYGACHASLRVRIAKARGGAECLVQVLSLCPAFAKGLLRDSVWRDFQVWCGRVYDDSSVTDSVLLLATNGTAGIE